MRIKHLIIGPVGARATACGLVVMQNTGGEYKARGQYEFMNAAICYGISTRTKFKSFPLNERCTRCEIASDAFYADVAATKVARDA